MLTMSPLGGVRGHCPTMLSNKFVKFIYLGVESKISGEYVGVVNKGRFFLMKFACTRGHFEEKSGFKNYILKKKITRIFFFKKKSLQDFTKTLSS